MQTLPASDTFRLNLHHASGAARWWLRRPWADAMWLADTSPFVPGRHNAAPLIRTSPKPRRARRAEPQATWHARPVQPQRSVVRRGLDAFGAGYGSLQVPAAVKLVADDEAARLEQARRCIAFKPKNGFLYSKPVGRLQRHD
jgi:hypothetical protein